MSRFDAEPSWQQELIRSNLVAVEDPLAVIYNEGLWKISKVSPLYNLQYDALKLKQYGTKLRQAIVSSVTTNSSVKYKVVFESKPDLVYSEDDFPGLMITIFSSQDNVRKNKIAYTAIFLSWGLHIRMQDAMHLPFLLERGEQRLGAVVKANLQTIFDCHIKQFQFTQNQLLQIGFKFLEQDTSQNQEQFSLVYKTPNVDFKDKLTISWDIGNVKIIWNGAQHEVSINPELLNLTYEILRHQIMDMMNLDITGLTLCEVKLPKGEIKSDGTAKMKRAEFINCLLSSLNEMYGDMNSTNDSSYVSP